MSTVVHRRNNWGGVRKLRSGRYQAHCRVGRVWCTAPTTFRTKREADEFLARTRADLTRRAWVLSMPARSPSMPVRGQSQVRRFLAIVAIGPREVMDLTRALPGTSQIASGGSCNRLTTGGQTGSGRLCTSPDRWAEHPSLCSASTSRASDVRPDGRARRFTAALKDGALRRLSGSRGSGAEALRRRPPTPRRSRARPCRAGGQPPGPPRRARSWHSAPRATP